MEEVTKKAGRTILFVSHNMSAIEKLCSKTLLLEKGQIVASGETRSVISTYLQKEYEKSSQADSQLPLTIEDVTLNSYDITQKGVKTAQIDADEPFDISIGFETHDRLTQFRIGVYIRNGLGDTLFRTCIGDWDPKRETIEKGRYTAKLQFPGRLLRAGNYFISMHMSRVAVRNYMAKHNIERAITVGPSAYYNQAHPVEKADSALVLSDEWSLEQN